MPEPRTDEATIRVRVVNLARLDSNSGNDVIRKECAVEELHLDNYGKDSIYSSNIMHKYEFGERNKDKSNKYSLFTRARMNRQ